MPPNQMPLVGREAIGDWGRAFFEQMEVSAFRRIPKEPQVFGDVAYGWGFFEGNVAPRSGGEPQVLNLKYMDILRRGADGSWKPWRHMFSENTPPGN